MGYTRDHKYHYIYKTTCSVTGKYYIGMHSTSNLDDGYIGSGQRLWKSIKKHGKENHSIEILEWLPDRSSLKAREKELVNESLLSDPMCMNLALGGGGGVTYTDKQIRSKAGLKSMQLLNERKLTDVDFRNRCASSSKQNYLKASAKSSRFSGKIHSPETKLKMSDSMKGKGAGSKNSQYGTCWITNTLTKQTIKIKKDQLQSYLDDSWKVGRKI